MTATARATPTMAQSTLTTDLTPHLAFVTGATGGIGKATSLALARLGCSIAIHYNSAADTARELVGELQQLGVRAAAFQADLSSYDAARKLHADVVRDMGHPTILFNNAGLTMGKSGVKEVSFFVSRFLSRRIRTHSLPFFPTRSFTHSLSPARSPIFPSRISNRRGARIAGQHSFSLSFACRIWWKRDGVG